MSVNICPGDIFWTTKHFVTKLGMVMLQIEPECHAKQKLFAVFKVTVTARAHIIKILLWLLYLLNCWFFGNQSWSDYRLSYAKASCGKIGLLHSRSRSQRRVKMSIFIQMTFSKPPNILLPNWVLWCIIMGWSVMQKKLFVMFKVKVTAAALMIKIWQFLLYLLNCWSFSTKRGLMVHYHKPECLMKKLDYCVQGQGHGKIAKCQWLFIQMLSSEMLNLILSNLVR